MPRIPRMDTDEGRRLYREYIVETTKKYVGYGLMGACLGGFILNRVLTGARPNRTADIVIVVLFLIGLVVHSSRIATKEAAKIKLEKKRRFPPPPIESQVAGSRPNEISTGDYKIRFEEERKDE